MSFSNKPNLSWDRLERTLSGRPAAPGDGNDASAWTRHRDGYAGPPPDLRDRDRRVDEYLIGEVRTPYAELHVHSNFSFLDGASHPEELVEEAVRQGLDAIALTDHDGMYGVVRFAAAAREYGMRTLFGAELSLGLTAAQSGKPDPDGEHLLVLARGLEGYRRLCRAISHAQLAGGEKGKPVYDLDEVVDELRGHSVVLTGCRKGAVRQALLPDGPAAAAEELTWLVDRFGRTSVYVELHHHGLPLDSEHNDLLARIAREQRVGIVATNNVHYAQPAQSRVADALAAVRARRSLDEMDGWLDGGSERFIRSGAEMAERFARWPGAVQTAAVLGVECAFDLTLVAPDLPPFPVPDGHDETSYLRELTWAGAADRYGPREHAPDAYAQLGHELDTIEKLGFPGIS